MSDEENDELEVVPTTGLRAYRNACGGITLQSFEDPHATIAISMDDARALREWLRLNIATPEARDE